MIVMLLLCGWIKQEYIVTAGSDQLGDDSSGLRQTICGGDGVCCVVDVSNEKTDAAAAAAATTAACVEHGVRGSESVGRADEGC